MAHYQYSKAKIRISIVVAAALSALVSGLAWMILTRLGYLQAGWLALGVAMIFFAFISAPTLLRFLRNESVLVIVPTGILDKRLHTGMLSWDQVRQIFIVQSEDEWSLETILWKAPNQLTPKVLRSNLSELQAEPQDIIKDLQRFTHVSMKPHTCMK